MLTQVGWPLAPPVFIGDEDKTRTAFLLHTILLILLAGVGLFLVLAWFQSTTHLSQLLIFWPITLLLLGMLFLNRCGYVQAASIITVSTVWLTLLASMLFNREAYASEFSSFVIPVLTAGLLLKRRSAIVVTGLSILAGLLLWSVKSGGLMLVGISGGRSFGSFWVQGISFLVAALLVTVAKNRIEEALAIVRAELAERKRLEGEREASQQQYEVLVQSIEGVVWEVDPKTFGFTFVSQYAEKLFGYPLRQWYEEANFWVNHLHSDDCDWAIAYIVAATERKEDYQFEYRLIAADGRVVWIKDLVKTCVKDDQNIRLRGVMVDITELKQREAALERRANEFAALYNISCELAAPQEVETVIKNVFAHSLALLQANGGGVFLYDASTEELELVVAARFPSRIGTRLAMGEGIAGRVAQSRQPLIVNDYQNWEHRSAKLAGLPCMALLEVPMIYGGELIGVLVVGEAETPRTFTEADARLLSLFAIQAASAVYNSRLLKKAP